MPPIAISSSCVPRSLTSPWITTAISSAFRIVDSRCAGLHGATEPGFQAVPADPCLLFMPALYQIGLDCIKGLVAHVMFDAAGIVYSGLFIHAEGYEKL